MLAVSYVGSVDCVDNICQGREGALVRFYSRAWERVLISQTFQKRNDFAFSVTLFKTYCFFRLEDSKAEKVFFRVNFEKVTQSVVVYIKN